MSQTAKEHVTWHDLVEALESAAELPTAMRSHLDRCASCKRLSRAATQLLALLEGARLPRLPDELVERTVDRVLDEQPATGAEHPPVWRRLLASLRTGLTEIRVAEVMNPLPAPAWRGAGSATERTLLFETDAYSVTLMVQADDPRGWGNLRGQVIPVAGVEIPDGSYALLHWPDEVARSPVGEWGEFSFGAVPHAPLRLAVVLGRQFLSLGPLLKPAASGKTDLRNS